MSTQMRFLIVDPDREAARALAAQLRPRGIASGALANPDQAISAVLRFSPALISVAADAGKQRGAEVVAALSRDVRTLHIPVVLVDRAFDGNALLEALRSGAADYLVHPLDEENDVPSLIELARRHHAPGAPAADPTATTLTRIFTRLRISGDLVSPWVPSARARFEHGQLVLARCAASSGEDALAALVAFPDLRFESARPASEASPEPDEVEEVLDLEVEVDFDEPPAPSNVPAPRCLVVDDEPDLLRLFSAYLGRVGLLVETAPDGVAGFEACLAHRPDLVVADLAMPRLDGWGLLRKIRDDPRLAETPVVFLSAHDDYREGLRAMGAGAQDYLAKGGKLDQLAPRVRSTLEPRERAREGLEAGLAVNGRIEQLGSRWLLDAIRQAKKTGTATFIDGLGTREVGFVEGTIVSASARLGSKEEVTGEAALEQVLRSREGTARFAPGAPPRRNLQAAAGPERLDEIAEALGRADEETMDALMVRASHVEVDTSSLALYERICPPFGREVARLIRDGKTPREILAETDLDPVEVIETARDMIRRRVVRLRGPGSTSMGG